MLFTLSTKAFGQSVAVIYVQSMPFVSYKMAPLRSLQNT